MCLFVCVKPREGMQLTNHTDYALRLLIYLFVHKGESASVAQIAQAYGVSSNTCPIAPVCALKTASREAFEAFLLVLDGHRLADFGKQPVPMRRLLNLI